MSTETTTHVSQLPNNNEQDNDLVNKILSELENISEDETHVDTIINSTMSSSAEPEESNLDSAAVNNIKPNNNTKKQVNSQFDNSMPSPQKIDTFFNSIDLRVIKKIFRMSTICALLFFVFALYNDTFVTLFLKFPLFLNATSGISLTTSGKLMQSICFGLVYFLINIFYFDN